MKAWVGGTTAALALAWGCAAQLAPNSREPLCDPGENIFCRCDGGEAGVKKCADDGRSFSACDHCEPRPSTTTTSASSSMAMSSSSSGGAGGAPGTSALSAPCQEDSECASASCLNGYCTHGCGQIADCPFPAAECVTFDGFSICMPACASASDCTKYGAPPSLCGYTKAIDDWGVTVCADWGSEHALVPPGSDCAPPEHEDCNLGYPHEEHVCTTQGVCAIGCYASVDCPADKTCTSGNPGSCG
jgi:hypothetical protein